MKAGSWFESLFSGENLSASQDQYRTRIELDQVGNASRIYIAHRGTEYIYVLETRGLITNNSKLMPMIINGAFGSPNLNSKLKCCHA